LTAEGIHREIKLDDSFLVRIKSENKAPKEDFRTIADVQKSPVEEPSTTTTEAELRTEPRVAHKSMTYVPPRSVPVAIPNIPIASAPTTPTIGKGHAHDPLEDILFLNIGTGEDCPEQTPEHYIVSESPSNVDINVYETAYQLEVERLMETRKLQGRRPTLYLTRRVENIKYLRDKELIVDAGRTRDELKASIKTFVRKAQKPLDERAEMQRLEGKEDLISRSWRNVRDLKDMVDEAREIVREEERRDGKRSDSRSDTWDRKRSGSPSQSRTPLPIEKERALSRSVTPKGGTPRSGTPIAAENVKA
jgi:[calcium/calmodulin-dependent protein kinase] kinase